VSLSHSGLIPFPQKPRTRESEVLNKLLLSLDERVLFPARTRYLVDWLGPHLGDSQKILDLGAADGRVAHALKEKVPADFMGCDVHVAPHAQIPIVPYDGRTLPFEDRSFDCVMMIDVLHHDVEPALVVQEAKRVSRRHILIKDHYYDNRWDFWGLQIMDYIGNAPYGIRLPYNYLNDSAWRSMFQALDLRIVHEAKFRYNLIDPCKHVLYKLAISEER